MDKAHVAWLDRLIRSGHSSTVSQKQDPLKRLTEMLFGRVSASWILPLLRPHLRAVLLLAVLTTLASVVGLLVPYFTKLIIDEALIPGHFQDLLFYTACLFATGLLALLAGMVNSVLHLRFSIRLLNELRLFLTEKMLQMPVSQHAQQRVGEILSRIDGDASQLQRFAFDAMLSGGGAVVRLLGSAGFMLWLDWQLALLVLMVAPLELAFLAWVRPVTQQRAEEVREEKGQLVSLLGETVAAVPVLQTLTAESERLRRFGIKQQTLTRSLIRQRLWSEWTGFVPAILSALVRAGILLFGGYRVIQGELQLGSLIAFISYLAFLLGPMKTLLGIYHTQAKVRASIKRLDSIAGIQAVNACESSEVPVPETTGDIRISNLTLAWPDSVDPVIDLKSLCIPAGNKVLLSGDSGAGKSTFCHLLNRFYEPDSGTISYAGIQVDQYQLKALRRKIVMVPQNGFLFHGTIMDNLRLSNRDLNEAQAWEVLEIVQLASWVKTQGGVDAVVGERALALSGGQRQRLSIARALLMPFSVIIFDESFSEIDPPTARKIIRCIDQRFPDTTRIYLAHGDKSLYLPLDQKITLSVKRPSESRHP